jgi:hypothetical protein
MLLPWLRRLAGDGDFKAAIVGTLIAADEFLKGAGH